MTASAVSNLLAYSCGLSLIVACAWLVEACARIRTPRALLLGSQLTLVAAVFIPLLSLVQPAKTTAGGLLPFVTAVTRVDSNAWADRQSLPTVITVIAVAGMSVRLAWLAFGCIRLRRWRLSATPFESIPEPLGRLERELGVRVRWLVSSQLTSAATYGLWRPVVLLAERDVAGPARTLELVARHELRHVCRRDWLFVVVEECLLALLWFEPAAWLLIDRIRLRREQAVDADVVHATRDSETYARALLVGAGLDWILPPQPASQWLRRRHLRHRIHSIFRGGTMSTPTLAKWTGVFAATLVVAGYSAIHAFPLQGSGSLQNERHVYSGKDPGIVLPRVVREVKPHYTQEAMDAHIEGFVRLAVIIEADGSVSDVGISESLDPTFGLDDEAVKAAWQWSFKPATKDGTPVAVEVTLELTFTLK